MSHPCGFEGSLIRRLILSHMFLLDRSYISDMALHTPYITFLSTSVSSEQIQQLRRS